MRLGAGVFDGITRPRARMRLRDWMRPSWRSRLPAFAPRGCYAGTVALLAGNLYRPPLLDRASAATIRSPISPKASRLQGKRDITFTGRA